MFDLNNADKLIFSMFEVEVHVEADHVQYSPLCCHICDTWPAQSIVVVARFTKVCGPKLHFTQYWLTQAF